MTALAQRLHAFDYLNKSRGSHIADGLNRMQDLVDGPIAEILAAKDADVQELEAWRAMMLAATTIGIPGNPLSLWPNSWPQNVAIVAYALHMERKDGERYRWLIENGTLTGWNQGRHALVTFPTPRDFGATAITNIAEAIDAALAGEGEK